MNSQTTIASHNNQDDYPWLPWGWCNLSRNPFGELTRDERTSLAVVDVADIASRVKAKRNAVQLIGRCGNGKTTRMLVLSRHFSDSSYTYLPEDKPCPPIPEGCPLLIDEAQRLPKAVLQSLVASGLPMVLATHRNLIRPLRRGGYEVTTMRIGKNNDAKLVCEVMNRRLIASCLDDALPVPQMTQQDAQLLVDRFGTNLRAIESYLYEVVQTQAYSHGEMRFIDSTR